jgi:hypothetical protein
MARGLPFPAFWLSLGGLIPFAACAAGAFIGQDSWRGFALAALIAYGAVILAFLGAVHWGLALAASAEAETRHARTRLTLGVVPALVGWGALLLPAWAGLTVLIAGFLGVWAAEEGGGREGLVPSRYLWLRRLLTLAVAVILSTVLMGLLLG